MYPKVRSAEEEQASCVLACTLPLVLLSVKQQCADVVRDVQRGMEDRSRFTFAVMPGPKKLSILSRRSVHMSMVMSFLVSNSSTKAYAPSSTSSRTPLKMGVNLRGNTCHPNHPYAGSPAGPLQLVQCQQMFGLCPSGAHTRHVCSMWSSL